MDNLQGEIEQLKYFDSNVLLLLLSIINTLQAAGVRDPDNFFTYDDITLHWKFDTGEARLVINDKCKITWEVRGSGLPVIVPLLIGIP